MSFDTTFQQRAGTREVADPKAMRALAHPLRLELLERLAQAGTLTAAQAAKLVGESAANCSFHFRILAKYGFVEPAPGGRGHVRPWRRVPGGIGIAEVHDDPETSASAHALTEVIVERHLEKVRAYRSGLQERLPREWQELGGHTNTVMHLTVEEMREVRGELLSLLSRYAQRNADPSARPEGARPVQLFAFAMPGPHPSDAHDEKGDGS